MQGVNGAHAQGGGSRVEVGAIQRRLRLRSLCAGGGVVLVSGNAQGVVGACASGSGSGVEVTGDVIGTQYGVSPATALCRRSWNVGASAI